MKVELKNNVPVEQRKFIANAIRSELLKLCSREIFLIQKSKHVLLINSQNSKEISKKYEKYTIVEKNTICNFPQKQSGILIYDKRKADPLFEKNEIESSPGSLSICDIRSKKVGIAEKKLKITRGSFNSSQMTSSREEHTAREINDKLDRRNAIKTLRVYANKLKLAAKKSFVNFPEKNLKTAKSEKKFRIPENPKKKIKIQQTDYFRLKKKNKIKSKFLLNQTHDMSQKEDIRKCFDGVCFSLNKKKEIVVKNIEDEEENSFDGVIQLHRMWPSHKTNRERKKKCSLNQELSAYETKSSYLSKTKNSESETD